MIKSLFRRGSTAMSRLENPWQLSWWVVRFQCSRIWWTCREILHLMRAGLIAMDTTQGPWRQLCDQGGQILAARRRVLHLQNGKDSWTVGWCPKCKACCRFHHSQVAVHSGSISVRRLPVDGVCTRSSSLNLMKFAHHCSRSTSRLSHLKGRWCKMGSRREY